MQCIPRKVKDNYYYPGYNTVPAEEPKAPFLQKGNEGFDGQHGYDEGDNAADNEEFNILVKVGRIKKPFLFKVP